MVLWAGSGIWFLLKRREFESLGNTYRCRSFVIKQDLCSWFNREQGKCLLACLMQYHQSCGECRGGAGCCCDVCVKLFLNPVTSEIDSGLVCVGSLVGVFYKTHFFTRNYKSHQRSLVSNNLDKSRFKVNCLRCVSLQGNSWIMQQKIKQTVNVFDFWLSSINVFNPNILVLMKKKQKAKRRHHCDKEEEAIQGNKNLLHLLFLNVYSQYQKIAVKQLFS